MTAPQAPAVVRNQQPCHGCGQNDDHPRHIVVNSLTDDSLNSTMHMDCCAADGGCGHCEPVLEVAGDKRGYDLLDHIVMTSVEPVDRNEGVAPVTPAVNRKG